MMFQQHMQLLPIDAEMLSTDQESSNIDANRIIDMYDLLQSRVQSFASASANIKNAQNKQKETYNRKHLQEELPIGAQVQLEIRSKNKTKEGSI